MKSKMTIIVDWRDIKSIKSAERKKSKLENAGYTLIRTVCGLDFTTLYYVLKEG